MKAGPSPFDHRTKNLQNKSMSKISCLLAKTGVLFYSKYHLVFPKAASQEKKKFFFSRKNLLKTGLSKVNLPKDQFTALLRMFFT